jgi:hypothetical protein
LKGTADDATNTILAAIGHNFQVVFAWPRIFFVPYFCRLLAPARKPFRAQIGLLSVDNRTLRSEFEDQSDQRSTI